MNIGVFFKHKPSAGGIYQYFLSIMESIQSFHGEDNFFLYHCHNLDGLDNYKQAGITTCNLSQQPITTSKGVDELHDVLHKGKKIRFNNRSFSKELETAAKNHQINLMLYTNIERESFESNLPYITAFHDWTHLTHPEFEEFVSNGVYDQREYINQNSTKNALAIFSDSKIAKTEIMTFYHTPAEKIVVLPFVVPPAARRFVTQTEKTAVKKKFNLPDRFIFYPAQFWPHKNHENIFRALHILKMKFSLQIPIVLVGSTDNPWSNLEKLKALANDLGISGQIIYPGYVADQDIAPLYMLALALVMPTYPGPTNIPVLEALSCDCPVITTDQPALREQLGDAAEFIDPYQPENIAHAIWKLYNGKEICKNLIEKGSQRLNVWTQNHFSNRLATTISTVKSIKQ